MTRFFASVDGPSLRIIGRTFHGGIEIVSQPTYGRVLFRWHFVEIRDCWFHI